MGCAKDGIGFHAVAARGVNMLMHANDSNEVSQTSVSDGNVPDIEHIVDAIVYLTGARHGAGEVLHVDAGMHNGEWWRSGAKRTGDRKGR